MKTRQSGDGRGSFGGDGPKPDDLSSATAEAETAEQEEKDEHEDKEFHETPLSCTRVLVFASGHEDGNPHGHRGVPNGVQGALAISFDPALPLRNAHQRGPARHVVAVEHAPELALDGLHPQ